MAYLLLEDFKFGLDSRRFKLNAPPGTLTVLTNGHITPGGEIEKRKAFENFYLPPDTFGLEVTSAGFEVYGSKAQSALTAGTQVATTKRSRSSNVATLTFAADPNIAVGDIVTITSAGGTGYNASQVTVTAASAAAPWTISYANTGSNEAETTDTAGRVAPVLPVNVTYVRLQHPDDANAVMTQVIHSTVYNGAAFVIADYGADGIVSFYDETAVDDLSPGRLANILADADALAAYIAAQLDATDTYAATASAGTVTVTGPTGQTFGVESSNESTCTTAVPTRGNVTAATLTLGHAPDDSFYIDVNGTKLVDENFDLGDGPMTYDLVDYCTNSKKISSIAINSAGLGYTVGQILEPSHGGFFGAMPRFTVASVGGSGEVTGISLTYAGRLWFDSFYGPPPSTITAMDTTEVWQNPNGITHGGLTLDVTLAAADVITLAGGDVLTFKTKDIFDELQNTVDWSLDVTYADGFHEILTGGTYASVSSTATSFPAYFNTGTATLGIDDPTITTEVISDGTQPQSGTIPRAQFSVIAVKNGGTGKVTSVTVGGTEILGTAATNLSGANYATTALLATAIKNQINTYCAANTLKFSATVSNGNIVAIRSTNPKGYAALTGATVVVTVDDDVCIGNGAVRFSRASAVDPTWTSILIDGAEQLGSTVPAGAWVDMTTAVAEVASTFNAYSTLYTAVAAGSTLYVSKLVTSSNDAAVQILPIGTNLNWEGASPGGGNTGNTGGVSPNNIVVDPSLDIPIRYLGRSGSSGAMVTTSEVSVAVGGSGGPFFYEWEQVDTGELVSYYKAYATDPVTFSALRFVSGTTGPVIKFSGTLLLSSTYLKTLKFILRCKVTDSLSRTTYSALINFHYP